MPLLLRILRGIKSILSPSNLKGIQWAYLIACWSVACFFQALKWWRVARNREQRKNKSDEGRRKSFCSPTPPCLSNPACSRHQDQVGRADREKLHENREQRLSMDRLSYATTHPPPPHRSPRPANGLIFAYLGWSGGDGGPFPCRRLKRVSSMISNYVLNTYNIRF